jgi:HSP20 family molecular chaperone IbpA
MDERKEEKHVGDGDGDGDNDNDNDEEKEDRQEKQEAEGEGDGAQGAPDQDILYVQDVGFNVKISVPGSDQFTIQVTLLCHLHIDNPLL